MKSLPKLSVAILLLTFCTLVSLTVNAKAQTLQSDTSSFRSLFNIRAFGARGDGKALDSPAINRAIEAAAAAGGGTVFFTAGTYRSFSIHLKSNVGLYFDRGATLVAADPKDGDGKYDLP